MAVRIAIPVPTSFDPAYNAQSWPEYARAVQTCGAEAVAMRPEGGEGEWAEQMQSVSGILLPGSGADVRPALYGHQAQPETAPADLQREALDWSLLHFAEANRTPLLAICFGLQSLNVFRGGTLVQHLQPMPVNHRAGRAVLAAHGCTFATGSRLGSILASADDVQSSPQDGFLQAMVNSSHHQAVGVAGSELRVVARATEDAVIEALEDSSYPFLVGVQWHPERTLGNRTSRRIFEAFVAEAAKHA